VNGIVGRDDELASLRAFVDDARDPPAAVVLESDAGIGRSTLWLAGVEHGRAQGQTRRRPGPGSRAAR
jgi:hypothetical protein